MHKTGAGKGTARDRREGDKGGSRKGTICVFAGRDSEEKNEELGRVMAFILHLALKKEDVKFSDLLENYFFVFTDGTFNRVFVSADYPPTRRGHFWDYWLGLGNSSADKDLERFFKDSCICLRGYKDGGILLIADMVVNQYCSIVWPFLDPHEAHCTRPENLALLRLCDVWKTKWLPNLRSVMEWAIDESKPDASRSKPIKTVSSAKMVIRPPIRERDEELYLKGKRGSLVLKGMKFRFNDYSGSDADRFVPGEGKPLRQETADHIKHTEELIERIQGDRDEDSGKRKGKDLSLALISHDAKKPSMVGFVVEYRKEIDDYVGHGGRILTTYATGKMIQDNILDEQFTKKIVPRLSGPLGGDIQIATEILFEKCSSVIFFLDPLSPHEHIDDIRVVLMAGMTTPGLRVLTNETAARAWAEALRSRYHNRIKKVSPKVVTARRRTKGSSRKKSKK